MAEQETKTEQIPASDKKNNNLVVIAIIILLALAGGAYYYFHQQNSDDQAINNGGGAVVATVNGTELTREEYSRNVNQLAGVYASQGIDTSNEQNMLAIQQEVLDTMINRQLILDAAANERLNVSDEEVETGFQEIVTNLGGEENLASALVSAGLDESTLRENIGTDLILQKFVNSHASLDNIVITDEEAETFYNSVKETNPEIGELSDLLEALKSQLALQKQQEQINELLNTLRSEADIQISL